MYISDKEHAVCYHADVFNLPQKVGNLRVEKFLIKLLISITWASLEAQMVKNLPAMQETQVTSLGWEDPLEMGMATHSSILAWRIPWTEESGGLQSTGSQKGGHK